MTTRPTTDGDLDVLRRYAGVDRGAFEAFQRLTTRISEQEVELERLRTAAGHALRDFEKWANPMAEEHGFHPFTLTTEELRTALTPTTQDQSEGT